MATPTPLPSSFVAAQVLTAAEMNDLRGAFRVLQVVSTTKTDTFSTTSTSFVDVTGLDATITPSSTSSKIYVVCQVLVSQSNNPNVFVKMVGGTNTYIGDAAGSRQRFTAESFPASATRGDTITISYVDSPASISAETYKLQICASVTGTVLVNRTGTDTDSSTFGRSASSITLMEISA
jgi:hypothetical protein